jgi:hypothetical protein
MIHHHAAFSPKSPEGNFPPAKSSFIPDIAVEGKIGLQKKRKTNKYAPFR